MQLLVRRMQEQSQLLHQYTGKDAAQRRAAKAKAAEDDAAANARLEDLQARLDAAECRNAQLAARCKENLVHRMRACLSRSQDAACRHSVASWATTAAIEGRLLRAATAVRETELHLSDANKLVHQLTLDIQQLQAGAKAAAARRVCIAAQLNWCSYATLQLRPHLDEWTAAAGEAQRHAASQAASQISTELAAALRGLLLAQEEAGKARADASDAEARLKEIEVQAAEDADARAARLRAALEAAQAKAQAKAAKAAVRVKAEADAAAASERKAAEDALAAAARAAAEKSQRDLDSTRLRLQTAQWVHNNICCYCRVLIVAGIGE